MRRMSQNDKKPTTAPEPQPPPAPAPTRRFAGAAVTDSVDALLIHVRRAELAAQAALAQAQQPNATAQATQVIVTGQSSSKSVDAPSVVSEKKK